MLPTLDAVNIQLIMYVTYACYACCTTIIITAVHWWPFFHFESFRFNYSLFVVAKYTQRKTHFMTFRAFIVVQLASPLVPAILTTSDTAAHLSALPKPWDPPRFGYWIFHANQNHICGILCLASFT